jgi:hypothetical protein
MFDRKNPLERQCAGRCGGRYRISLLAICTFFFVIVSAGHLRAATTPITPTSPEGINITNAANLLDELGQKQAAQEIKAKLAAGGYSYGNIDGNAETDFATSNLRSSTAISTGFVHFAPGAQSQANRFDFKLRLACLLFHENVHANQGYFNYRKNSFEPPAWMATINMEMTWVSLAVQGLPTNLWPGNNPTSGGRPLSPQETLALIKELKSYIAEFRAGEGHDPYYGLDPKSPEVTNLIAWETYLNSAEPAYQAIVNATATPAAAGTSSPASGGASGTASGTNQPSTPAGPSTNPTNQPTQANNNPGGTTTPAPQTPPSTGGNTPPDANQPAPGGGTPQTPSNPQPPAPTNSGGVNLAPGAPGGAAAVPGSATGATPAPAAASPKEIGSTTNNGVTTTVFRNPDGTLTTVSKDAQGNTVANPAPPIPPTVTTPPAAASPKEIGSTTNNGVTTTVFRNPDGTLTTVSKDGHGNTVANPAPPIPPTVTTPPPAAAGPKEIGSTTNNGVTTTVFRNPDGTLTTVSKDAQGNTIANPAPPIPPTVTAPPVSNCPPGQVCAPTNQTAAANAVASGATPQTPNSPGGTTLPAPQTNPAIGGVTPQLPTGGNPPTFNPAANAPDLGNGGNSTIGAGASSGNTVATTPGGGAMTNSPTPPTTGLTPEETSRLAQVFTPSPCSPCEAEWNRFQMAIARAGQHVREHGVVSDQYHQEELQASRNYYQCEARKCAEKPSNAQPGAANAIGGGAASGAPNPNPTGGNNVIGAGALNFTVPNSLLLNATNTALNGIVVPMIQNVTVSLPATNASPSDPNPGANMRIAPRDPNVRSASTTRRTGGWMQLAAFHPRDPLLALSPRGLLGWLGVPEPQAGGAGQLIYSLVANGNSSGQALELQVFDPSGAVKNPDVPEGMVLEPLKQGSAKPVSEIERGANILKKPLVAYCVDYAKLPPEAGMLYRLAPQAVQDKFGGIRSVLQAGRELAAAGKFHPDSDADAYKDSIRQYALWTKIGNWDQQKFGEVFLEKTQENAVAAKVKWTKQMAQVVSGLVPGRWRDISMVLDEASKLSSAPGNPNQIHGPPN